MKQCLKCTEKFEPSKGLINYCSLECRNSRNWSEEDKRKRSLTAHSLQKIECIFCKEKFKPKSSKRIYCSKKCYGKSEQAILTGRNGGLISSISQNRRSKNEIYFYE